MYKSLKQWMNLDVVLYTRIATDVHGLKQYASPVSLKCYAEHKQTNMVSREGTSVTSNTILYVDNQAWTIVEGDEVLFAGRRLPVKTVAIFYTGEGMPDALVVYI